MNFACTYSYSANPAYSFIPSPSLSDETLECSCCFELLSDSRGELEQLAITHEGLLGKNHPPIHLKCCLKWIEESDLCMFCKAPLSGNQLTLLLERLQTSDFISLSREDLSQLAKEAKKEAKTPLGKFKCAVKTLTIAMDHFEPLFLQFKIEAENYELQLQESVIHLCNELTSSTKKEYLLEESLLFILSLIVPEAASRYHLSYEASEESRAAFNKKTRAALEDLSKPDLGEPFYLIETPPSAAITNDLEQKMHQIADKLRSIELQTGQINDRIQNLIENQMALSLLEDKRKSRPIAYAQITLAIAPALLFLAALLWLTKKSEESPSHLSKMSTPNKAAVLFIAILSLIPLGMISAKRPIRYLAIEKKLEDFPFYNTLNLTKWSQRDLKQRFY